MKFNKGFTLIEMLIVIAIISILASVFLVGLRGFRGSAYDARRIQDLQKVQSYLELYYGKNRVYPDAPDWNALRDALVNSGIGIDNIPNDPISDQTYQYGVDTTDFQSYVLAATLTPDNAVFKEQTTPTDSIYGVNCGNPVFCVKF